MNSTAKTTLITGVTNQRDARYAAFLLKKGYLVNSNACGDAKMKWAMLHQHHAEKLLIETGLQYSLHKGLESATSVSEISGVLKSDNESKHTYVAAVTSKLAKVKVGDVIDTVSPRYYRIDEVENLNCEPT